MISKIRELNDAELKVVAGGFCGFYPAVVNTTNDVTTNKQQGADKSIAALEPVLRG
jgi:hypothetical protein